MCTDTASGVPVVSLLLFTLSVGKSDKSYSSKLSIHNFESYSTVFIKSNSR